MPKARIYIADICLEKDVEDVEGFIHHAASFGQPEQAQPAPTPTGWQPIETAPTDVLHVRGLWVLGPGKHGTSDPLYFEQNVGIVDEYGYFVDVSGREYTRTADQYTHWHSLAIPPAPGGSDE